MSSRDERIAALEAELAALRAETEEEELVVPTTTTTTTTRTPWDPGQAPTSPQASEPYLNAQEHAAYVAARQRIARQSAELLRAEFGVAHQSDVDFMVDRIFGAVREIKGDKGKGQGDKGKGQSKKR